MQGYALIPAQLSEWVFLPWCQKRPVPHLHEGLLHPGGLTALKKLEQIYMSQVDAYIKVQVSCSSVCVTERGETHEPTFLTSILCQAPEWEERMN